MAHGLFAAEGQENSSVTVANGAEENEVECKRSGMHVLTLFLKNTFGLFI